MTRAAFALVALLGLAAQGEPDDQPVSLRFDSVHEVTKGSIANPFQIGVGPDGVLAVGQPAYVKASFKATAGNKKVKEADQRKVRHVIEADRVPIEVQFPPADPDGKPLRVAGWLRPDFCCGKGLDGTFTPPADARRGEVTLRISWPSSGRLRAGSTTLDVTLPADKEPR